MLFKLPVETLAVPAIAASVALLAYIATRPPADVGHEPPAVAAEYTPMVVPAKTPMVVPAAPPVVTIDAFCDPAYAAELISSEPEPRIVRETYMSASEGAVLVVNQQAWSDTSSPGKEMFAAVLDCAVSGPGKHLRAMHFRASRHSRDLTTLSAYDLLKLRERGLARHLD